MVLIELCTFLAATVSSPTLVFAQAGTAGQNVFYGRVPAAPDSVVVLMEYGGLPDEPDTGGAMVRLEYPAIQVLCRGAKDDYDTPDAWARAVRKALVSIVNQSLSGVRYLAVEPKQPPFFLRRDQNDRIEMACNYQVTKVPSA